MSFIYDDSELILKLLQSGLDHQVKFTKEGQLAAGAVQAQDRANLLAMINSLKQQLDPNRQPQISWEGDQKPTLDDTTLESLGDLVSWLAGNKMTLDGQRIVFGPNENPNNKDWIFYRLQTHMNAPEQRDQQANGFFVNAKLLTNYVHQLQAYEAANPNPTMRLQLGGIVQEMNRSLGTQASEQYQAPDKVLSDNRLLDNVPDKFVSTEASGYGGDIPLQYKDLKDQYAFNTWLRDKGIQTAKGQGQQLSFSGFGNPSFDTCLVLKVLFYRAQRQPATSKDAQEQSQIYARQISSIAQQVGCDLSGRGGASSADMQGGQGQNGRGATSQQQMQNLAVEIVDTRPFDLQNIDFDRIRNFFGLIKQLMGNQQGVVNTIGQVDALMQQATAYTQNGDTRFSLGIPATSIIHMLKPNARTGFPAANLPVFISYLRRVLDGTRAVYDYFIQQHIKGVPSDRQGEAYGQVGARPGDDSIYKQNLEYLNQWNLPVR